MTAPTSTTSTTFSVVAAYHITSSAVVWSRVPATCGHDTGTRALSSSNQFSTKIRPLKGACHRRDVSPHHRVRTHLKDTAVASGRDIDEMRYSWLWSVAQMPDDTMTEWPMLLSTILFFRYGTGPIHVLESSCAV